MNSLWETIEFYDGIAKKVLGRSPSHVLLLYENDMAALFVDDLVAHIRLKGWEIISPIEAYKDPISRMVPDVLFNNQGRIAAIAHSKGMNYLKRVMSLNNLPVKEGKFVYDGYINTFF